MSRKLLIGMNLLALLVVGLLLLGRARRAAASGTALTLDIYNQVVDEQNTTAFYHNGTPFCLGSNQVIQQSALKGDFKVAGPMTAYQPFGPWTLASGLSSTSYVAGTDCGTNCLQVGFRSNNTIFSLDTRGTTTATGPRTLSVSFATPCGTAQGCPGPAGSPTVFGGHISPPGLLNVFLDFPYTNMQVCSSATCSEAQPAFAKFWFADPFEKNVTWRIDWHFLRVLRLSANTWYLIGDECDGSQVAGLSQLIGNRTRPKTVFNGYYKMPFFYAAAQ